MVLPVLLLACTCVSGQTAEELLSNCEKGVPQGTQPTAKDLSCVAFLKGFVSGLHAAQLVYTGSVNGQAPMARVNVVCLPKEGISPEETRRIVVKYMQDYPEELHQHEDIAVLVALMKAFPACKQQP
jgi:hypothetical protein